MEESILHCVGKISSAKTSLKIQTTKQRVELTQITINDDIKCRVRIYNRKPANTTIDSFPPSQIRFRTIFDRIHILKRPEPDPDLHKYLDNLFLEIFFGRYKL
jgi:hypothetical protein